MGSEGIARHLIERELARVKRMLIHDHVDHCLEETIGPLSLEMHRSVDEFREIAKYL